MEEPGPGTMLPNYLGFNPALNMYNAQAPVPAGPSNMPNPYEFNGLVVRSGIPQAQPLPSNSTAGTVRAFDEHQVARWDNYRGPQSRGLSAGEFAINYEEGPPLAPEEVDVLTQEEQCVLSLFFLSAL